MTIRVRGDGRAVCIQETHGNKTVRRIARGDAYPLVESGKWEFISKSAYRAIKNKAKIAAKAAADKKAAKAAAEKERQPQVKRGKKNKKSKG